VAVIKPIYANKKHGEDQIAIENNSLLWYYEQRMITPTSFWEQNCIFLKSGGRAPFQKYRLSAQLLRSFGIGMGWSFFIF